VKILHTADTHLEDSHLEDIRPCTEHLYNHARSTYPDLIIHAGDVFNSQHVKLDSLSAKYAIDWFARLADIAPVVLIEGTPSHEGHATEVFRHISARYPIHVSSRPEQIYLTAGTFVSEWHTDGITPQPDAIISTLPTPTKEFWQGDSGIEQADADISRALGAIMAGFGVTASQIDAPHILTAHCQYRGCQVSPTQALVGRDIELSKDQIEMARIHLGCFGHIHMAQEMPGHVFFAGSNYRKNYGEMEEKGFYIHELNIFEMGDLSTKWVSLPSRKLVKISTEAATLIMHGCAATFEDHMGQVDGSHVRVEIRAWQDEADTFSRDSIREFLTSAGAESVDVRVSRIPRENVRGTEIMEAEGLPAELTALAASRGEEIPPGVLAKARALESETPEAIIEAVRNGSGIRAAA